MNEAVSLGYVALRIVESTLIVVGLISLMSVVTLRDDLGGSGDSASLSVAGHALVALHDWTFLLGPQFCAGFGNGLLLGYLMYKSGLVPPRAALVGLVGGPLAFLGGVFVLFGALDQPSSGLFVLTAPEIAWEAFIAIYMTFWGFRPVPGRPGVRPAGAADLSPGIAVRGNPLETAGFPFARGGSSS